MSDLPSRSLQSTRKMNAMFIMYGRVCDTYLKCSRNKVLCKPRVREVTRCRVNLKLYKIKNSMEEVPLELDLEGQIKS